MQIRLCISFFRNVRKFHNSKHNFPDKCWSYTRSSSHMKHAANLTNSHVVSVRLINLLIFQRETSIFEKRRVFAGKTKPHTNIGVWHWSSKNPSRAYAICGDYLLGTYSNYAYSPSLTVHKCLSCQLSFKLCLYICHTLLASRRPLKLY